MRFGAHQTFYLKASWLHKGLSAVLKQSDIFSESTAMVKLGMGKNMLESLRYWLEATCLVIKMNPPHVCATDVAKEIFNNDPYFELDGTLHLVHYLLASNKDGATVWHWFFNKFSAAEFDTDSLNIYLQSYISTHTNKKIKANTLAKDINCLLKMYRTENYDQKYDPEMNSPSPFSRFKWIEKRNNRYFKRKVMAEEITSLIFVFTLYLFWTKDLQEVESINIEDIARKENSPGLIFGLSLDKCIEIIDTINRLYQNKYLRYSKSGGYFIVNIEKRNAKNALIEYYKENQMIIN